MKQINVNEAAKKFFVNTTVISTTRPHKQGRLTMISIGSKTTTNKVFDFIEKMQPDNYFTKISEFGDNKRHIYIFYKGKIGKKLARLLDND